MIKTFSFKVPNSFSLNRLRSDLKEFLKKSRFVMDPSDLRRGTVIRVDVKSKTELLSLISYCIKNNFGID